MVRGKLEPTESQGPLRTVMSTTIETTPRRDWLREELAMLEEALSSSRQPVTPGLQGFALAARLA